jgi:hypothetical protein
MWAQVSLRRSRPRRARGRRGTQRAAPRRRRRAWPQVARVAPRRRLAAGRQRGGGRRGAGAPSRHGPRRSDRRAVRSRHARRADVDYDTQGRVAEHVWRGAAAAEPARPLGALVGGSHPAHRRLRPRRDAADDARDAAHDALHAGEQAADGGAATQHARAHGARHGHEGGGGALPHAACACLGSSAALESRLVRSVQLVVPAHDHGRLWAAQEHARVLVLQLRNSVHKYGVWVGSRMRGKRRNAATHSRPQRLCSKA